MGSFKNNQNNGNSKQSARRDPPVPAYQGDEPYIFISYSHQDSDLVYPELERFYNDGYKIWYDEGITSGKRWVEVVEDALKKSSLCVYFITPNSVESENVRKEVKFALKKNIEVIPIYLEESELKYGLELSLELTSPIYKYELDENEYVQKYREKFKNNGFEFDESNSPINERINNPPFQAYQGDEPYIFISYSHKDSSQVFYDIKKFHDDGYRIWYDEGIMSGERWQAVIQKALTNCSLFVPFISKNSVESKNVRDEIFFAIRKEIPVIPIFLESTELEYGLGLQLESVQSIYRHRINDEKNYIEKCLKGFKKCVPELKEKTSPSSADSNISDDETEKIIKLIEEKASNLDEKSSNDFSQMIEQYENATPTQKENMREYVNDKLKSILGDAYVDEYIKEIENAPDVFEYPSMLLEIQSDWIKHEIIQSTFSRLESGSFTNQDLADELIQQGHEQRENDDFKGLEKTVVLLYNESQGMPSGKTDSPSSQEMIIEKQPDDSQLSESEQSDTTTENTFDPKEHKLLIVLDDGTNLTSWDDVTDKNSVISVSEDLSDYTDLTNRYSDLKSLKTIVATNVSCDVTNMEGMFSGCASLVDISSLKEWNTRNVADMNGMFKGCTSLKDISALKDWNTENVTDMNGMFDGCTSLKDISALENWNTGNVSDISGMFYACSSLTDTFSMKNWDTNNVKFMSRMFRGCSSLADASALKNWNISNVKDMNGMFKGCSSLTDIFALKKWNISNTTDLNGFFYECSSLEDISAIKNWKTKNVVDMNMMFKACSSLEDISALKDWKTENVTDMSGMFEDCKSLTDILALKNWTTKKLKDTNRMFYNCPSLTDATALKNWDSSSIIYMNDMFGGTTSIKKLPKWYK